MMWMMLWMVVFWAVIIGGGVWVVVSLSRGGRDTGATDILRDRLARGEIDVDEFNTRMAAISGPPAWRRHVGWWAGGAAVLALLVLVVVPVVVMAADGWDMWDMHAGGRNTSGDPAVRGGLEATIEIDDFAFRPGNLEVPAGAQVTWVNRDSARHDATARGDEWETERLREGESDTLVFEEPGVYDYVCSIHPDMRARLTVLPD